MFDVCYVLVVVCCALSVARCAGFGVCWLMRAGVCRGFADV